MSRAWLLVVLLLAGCVASEDDAPDPPGPTPPPSTPAPEPTPQPAPEPTTPPATPTPSAPTPTKKPDRRVEWVANLSVGSATPVPLPQNSLRANCQSLGDMRILRGQANATWTAGTDLTADLELLLLTPAGANTRVSGPSPLSITFPAITPDASDPVKVVVQLAEEPPAPQPTHQDVRLDIWFEVPGSDGVDGQSGPETCPRVE